MTCDGLRSVPIIFSLLIINFASTHIITVQFSSVLIGPHQHSTIHFPSLC
ncbi:hypothetical protein HanRHA438_Chr06g0258721 [Helianthus annuus]|nr:hypothetical protein HanRHA438_Chr06g0258721 [Helianthus annuus]